MKITVKPKGGPAVANSSYYVNDSGQAKDAWFKDEELMRRKLEKQAIAQLKGRIAQQNRAAGNSKNAPVELKDDADSDLDPNDIKDDGNLGVGGVTNPTQVQLNPQQVEEAKLLTHGKLKQFRRDRTMQSDKERFEFLINHLKKNRIVDDQNVYNVGYNNYGSSPNRTTQGKNAEPTRGVSPSKVSPNKTTGAPGTKQLQDSTHTNNGQVMTQISAIYAKRSRSILN